jgi:protein-tyrosine phosphatase
MAEALLRRHLDLAGVAATVSSAGLYPGGVPATDHGVATMADRGLDLRGHRSRQLDREMLGQADLVIAMARRHVREVVVLLPEALRKTFTLKELARGAATVGARRPEEPLEAWLGRIADARSTDGLVGVAHDDTFDVADPIGLGRPDYERTADLLHHLLGGVVDLAFPVAARPEGQRA